MNKNYDIRIEGAGVWYVIHTLALHTNTDLAKDAYIITINTLCDHFGCESCKPHFKQFIIEHPFHKYRHINYKGEDYGFFKWSWELHNSVNYRLNKPIISFEDALFKYKNNTCTDCDKINNPILIEIEKKNLNLLSYY